MKTTRRGLGILAVALGLAGPLTVAAGGAWADPATLRWKFKPGETLRYRSNQVTSIKGTDPTGQSMTQSFTLTIDLTWAVKEVDPAGVATLTQRIDRLRTSATLPFGKVEQDSDNPKDADSPAGPLFKLLVGSEFTFKMTPRGEIDEVKLSDKLSAAVRDANQGAGGQTQFNEAGLKNMLKQMGVPLPENPVEKSQTWARKVEVPAGPDGQTRTIEQTYTDEGPAAAAAAPSGADAGKPPGRESISMKTAFDKAPTDPGMPITIKKQEATGRFGFDNALGRLAESTVVEKLDVSAQIQGKEIGQESETTTTLTLLPN